VTELETAEAPDEAPEPPVEPKTVKGDLYELNGHRVLCGDSTVIDDTDKLMQGERADLVFTDPPYSMHLDTDFSSMKNEFKGKQQGNTYSKVIGDNDDFTPELINTIFANFDYCKEIFIWGSDYFAELLPEKNKGSWIVWDKRLTDEAGKMYGSEFELCWSKSKHKRKIFRVKWAGIFGTETQDIKHRVHPTQKPLELILLFLQEWSRENCLVVDLFAGSGSTLIACEQAKRKNYSIELEPKYCDVIVTRWVKMMQANKKDYIIKRNGEVIDWDCEA
jgi:DNA modification methylase